MTPTVLLLAGTRDARAVAQRWSMSNIRLMASLAGATSDPVPYPCEVRTGGFGGADGLSLWLVEAGIAAVIDATHPFAVQMSANAAKACTRTETPRLRLQRDPWPVEGGMTEFDTFADLSRALPSGARVLLTTGHAGIDHFSARTDVWFLARSIEPLDAPPPHIETMLARPPFSLAEEEAVMIENRITHLVTKNAGGARPAKLDAARARGIEIYSVAMPPAPAGDVVSTPDEALAWVRQLPIP